jgi:hypothetical protein
MLRTARRNERNERNGDFSSKKTLGEKTSNRSANIFRAMVNVSTLRTRSFTLMHTSAYLVQHRVHRPRLEALQ